MRVLPRWGMTAPRLALLKSYCFFIDLDLTAFREASGDEPDFVAPVRVHHDDHSTAGIETDADKLLFTLRARVFHRKTQRVEEYRLSVREADRLLLKIRLGLGWVSADIHAMQYMYTICIYRGKLIVW